MRCESVLPSSIHARAHDVAGQSPSLGTRERRAGLGPVGTRNAIATPRSRLLLAAVRASSRGRPRSSHLGRPRARTLPHLRTSLGRWPGPPRAPPRPLARPSCSCAHRCRRGQPPPISGVLAPPITQRLSDSVIISFLRG